MFIGVTSFVTMFAFKSCGSSSKKEFMSLSMVCTLIPPQMFWFSSSFSSIFQEYTCITIIDLLINKK